jgi:uncharacterized protein (TIGR02271 family)
MAERPDTAPSVVRHEEKLRIGTAPVEVGAVRVRKELQTEDVSEDVPRDVERADSERTGPLENDSGQVETLPDGSVSVPVFEEEIVVMRRLVVRERIVIRKTTTSEVQRVEEEVRKVRVEVEVDEEVS